MRFYEMCQYERQALLNLEGNDQTKLAVIYT